MNEQDRIKLAEAMGWHIFQGHWQPPTVSAEQCKTFLDRGENINWAAYELPDPFTDANDDYAVLRHFSDVATGSVNVAFICAVDFTALNYQVGDYARAALKVLP